MSNRLFQVVQVLLVGVARITAQASAGTMTPTRLLCDFRTDPMGIDSTNPRLDWILQTGDPASRDLTQGAYQIVHVIIHPTVVGDLTEVKAGYDSVRGKVISEWKRDGQHLTLRVILPPNTTATITLPGAVGASAVREVGSGDYTFETLLP